MFPNARIILLCLSCWQFLAYASSKILIITAMEHDDEESESPEKSGWDEETVNRILQSIHEEDEEAARRAADRSPSSPELESPEESGWDEETVNRILQSIRGEDEEAARLAADRPLSPPHFTNPGSASSASTVQVPTVTSSADTPSYDTEKYPLIYFSSESTSPERVQTKTSPTPSPPLPSITALSPTLPPGPVVRLPETTSLRETPSLNPIAPVYKPRWIETRDEQGRRQFRNAITNETTYWEQVRDTTTAFRRYAYFNYETSERLSELPEGELYRPCIKHEIYSTLRSQPAVRRDAEAWVGRHEQPSPDTSNARVRTSTTARWQSWSVERARAREANERQGPWRNRRNRENDDDDDLYS
ncbi:hypothetical protein BDV97DRAFT_372829 [Delphinella strobiligena]|nr:hypothetical protein BDV97DRAFT_372829 [Delphinella strobiligena]